MMDRIQNKTFNFGFLSVLVLAVIYLTLSVKTAWAEQCSEIVKLYQESLRQYDLAQKSYLKAGCIESPENKAQCKGLEAAAREIQATVDMFAMRANLLKCNPQDAKKAPANRCQRFKSLTKRAQAELLVLQKQYQTQRCEIRHFAPACKALDKAMFKPKELVKAARRDALKANCKLE